MKRRCGKFLDVMRLHRLLVMVAWVCVIFGGVDFPVAALAAAEDTKLYEPSQLLEDFTILRSALEDAHIGLYRYTDKPDMDAAFDETLKSLKSPLSEREFLKRLAPLLALIRDDHTFVLPSDAYWRRLLGNRGESGPIGLFPFYVKVIGERIFISHNNSSDASIPVGSEILSVNGLEAKELINTLQKYVHTSGSVTTFKPRHLEQFNINQEFNIFCIYYAVFVATPRNFKLRIQRPGAAAADTVTVAALPQSELLANFRARYNSTNDWVAARNRAMDFTMPRADTAVLRLSSFHEWVWNRDKAKPEVELSKVFETLKNKRVSNLIVDLRGNEGGKAAITVEVLSRLVTAPFQLYSYKELKGYEFPKYAPYLRETAPKFAESLFEITPQHTYRIKTSLPDETWSRPLPPAGTNFTGKLYVLIDGATGSAAAQLATAIRINRRDAIFIGEESGGDMEGPVSGSYLALKLPHTGVRVDVPMMKKVLNLNDYPYQRGRGVLPDSEAGWTQNDLIEHRDPVLQKALSLIEAVKK